MHFDDSTLDPQAFLIDIAHWDARHRDFWISRLGRRYLLSVVPTRSRGGSVLEIGAAWYNKYQTEVVGRDRELTVVDIKEPDSPDLVAMVGPFRYFTFDMTQDAGVPGELVGAFDEIRSWGVLSHYGFTPEQCRVYLDNVHAFLKPGGQVIFKLDIDTHKTVKQLASVGVDFLEGLIRERFTILHGDTLGGNTPGHVLYAERRER